MYKKIKNSNFKWDALNESSCGSLQTFSASILIQELIRLNVTNFIISPGARSIPLILGLNNLPEKLKNKIKVTLVNDERSAAFLAQGISKAGDLACLICTTGTAAANYLPGIVESFYSKIPLVVITADRPWELQNAGANQTINQGGIFKNFVGFEMEIPALERDLNVHSFLSNIDQLVYSALGLKAPVHLNIAYRKPFYDSGYVPENDLNETDKSRLIYWSSLKTPYLVRHSLGVKKFQKTDISIDRFGELNKIMIIAGPLTDASLIGHVQEISFENKIPVIADIHSNLRQLKFDGKLSLFNLYLNQINEDKFIPDLILHVGGRLISDEAHKFISDNNIKLISVNDSFDRNDAIENEFIFPEECITINDFLTLGSSFRENATEFFNYYLKLEADYQELTDTKFENELTERCLIKSAVKTAPENTSIFFSASLIFREADSFVFEASRGVTFFGNRGATGIDGIISSAIGTVFNSGNPLLCVVGDQAALHDLNGLGLLENSQNGVLILIINNSGGSIFNMMKKPDLVPTLINPHSLNFKNFAEGFGLEYFNPNNLNDFISIANEVFAKKTKAVVEVKTDGKQSVNNLLKFQ